MDTLFGFIEAYVVCPSNISRPFLPYRDENNTLIFPTGNFIGVYYSEELKYARDLGYSILPLRGYMFEKKSSPFEGFISSLYKSRQEAKKAGNEAMSFFYKICMNSLYGRFGINPESTVTEICNEDQYQEWFYKDNFQSADKLTDDYYIVNYISNSCIVDDTEWKAPKLAAVHLSAAITACSRIHMYPFISRPDSYYTDTDSVVLSSLLPEDLISSSEMGKFKLENKVKRGIFLAPKSYMLDIEDDRHIIKHKGPAKDLVTSEWFVRQLADLSRTDLISSSANFRIDWSNLQIVKKDFMIKLGFPRSTKRKYVYNENDEWIDTEPKEVIDIGSQDATTIYKYEKVAQRDNQIEDLEAKIVEKEKDKIIEEKDKEIAEKDKVIEEKDKEIAERDKLISETAKKISLMEADQISQIEDDKIRQLEKIHHNDKILKHENENDYDYKILKLDFDKMQLIKEKISNKIIMNAQIEILENDKKQLEKRQLMNAQNEDVLNDQMRDIIFEIYHLEVSKKISNDRVDEKIIQIENLKRLRRIEIRQNITERKGKEEMMNEKMQDQNRSLDESVSESPTDGMKTIIVEDTLHNSKDKKKRKKKGKYNSTPKPDE